MVSDNGKTFKSASKAIERIFDDPEVNRHFADLRVEWNYLSEWSSLQRIKAIGRASLTYDELLTLVTEMEAVLNLLNQDHSLTFPQMTPKSLSLRLTYWLATEFYLYQIQPFLKIQITTSLLNDLNRRMKHLTETSRNVGKGNIYSNSGNSIELTRPAKESRTRLRVLVHAFCLS